MSEDMGQAILDELNRMIRYSKEYKMVRKTCGTCGKTDSKIVEIDPNTVYDPCTGWILHNFKMGI